MQLGGWRHLCTNLVTPDLCYTSLTGVGCPSYCASKPRLIPLDYTSVPYLLSAVQCFASCVNHFGKLYQTFRCSHTIWGDLPEQITLEIGLANTYIQLSGKSISGSHLHPSTPFWSSDPLVKSIIWELTHHPFGFTNNLLKRSYASQFWDERK